MELVSGELKTKVGLREGGDGTTKDGSHIQGRDVVGLDGNKCAFVEVNAKPRGSGEVIEDLLEVGDMQHTGGRGKGGHQQEGEEGDLLKKPGAASAVEHPQRC
jgi:hypothetical protein